MEAKTNTLPLRNASDPYILVLDEGPFTLTHEKLEEHTDRKDFRRKTFHYPDISFVSFEAGMLEIKVSNYKECYTILIQTNKELLQIACSCTSKVHLLCCHTYYTLHKLILIFGRFYFERYNITGLVELSQQYPKYFKTTYDLYGISVKEKKEIGRLMLPSSMLSSFSMLMDKSSLTTQKNDEVIGYAIIHSRKPHHLPFILPYYGKLNKAETEVKSFTDFIRCPENLPDIPMNASERILNTICFAMYRLVHELPSTLMKDPERFAGIAALHELWEQAIPILAKQRNTYEYHSYWLRYVRQKPRKGYIVPCKVHESKPLLSLQPTDHGDHHKFRIKMTLEGKAIGNIQRDNSFLLWVKRSENHVYLMSLRDAALLEWAGAHDVMSVFKMHYKTINESVLKHFGCAAV